VLNLWKLFVECRLNTVITVYRAVKLTSGQIISKRKRQGLRIMREYKLITADDIVEASTCFGPAKEALRGRRFSSDEEAIVAVHKKKLLKRRNRCVEVEVDYVEKQY
jgi:hypothetical protein